MPTYKYRCKECATVYEEQRKFAEVDEPTSCVNCESPSVERLYSAYYVFMKGRSSVTMGGGGCGCSTGGVCGCQAG